MLGFKKLCNPAKLYFGLSILAIIFAIFHGVKFTSLIYKSIFVFIWTYMLGLLCKKGFSIVSWGLVIIPYIIGIFILSNMREPYVEPPPPPENVPPAPAPTIPTPPPTS